MMVQYSIKKEKSYENDVENTIFYIIHTLKNPDAARALIYEIENAIKKRSKMPKAFKPYIASGQDKRNIYKIKIQNFYAFYRINEKKKQMIFLAFIYARMDANSILDKIE